MKIRTVLAFLAFAVASVPAANASIVLNFAGLDGQNREKILEYYNGGFGSLGSGPGPNFGSRSVQMRLPATAVLLDLVIQTRFPAAPARKSPSF
jgi:hypothetical protein